jgi:enolase-phosphatase E1
VLDDLRETQSNQPIVPPTARIQADVVLLDIEGTIGPITFVRDVLFPYSRERLRAFIAANHEDTIVKGILDEAANVADGRDPIDALDDWQAKDVKAPPLKKLQGLIWESGYRSGAFRSEIFPDAFRALERWKADGLRLYIYSSGSVQAQLLYFEFSSDGDVRPFFSGYFDTDIGSKIEAASYHRIGERIGAKPNSIAFFSDNAKELEAARAAGLQTVHVVKDATTPDPDFIEISDFSQIAVSRLGTL